MISLQTIKIIFAILSVTISVIAYYPYTRDIFLNKTKPHAYTWLIWSITQGTAVVGLWYGGGGGVGSVALAFGAIWVFIIFIISLKKGTRNITLLDTTILTGALLAIFVWWQLNNPLLAIIMVSGIDIIGYVPSIVKSWHDPWSETLSSWVLFSISGFFLILSLNQYNLFTLTYISAVILGNIIMVIVILWRKKTIKRRVRDKTINLYN